MNLWFLSLDLEAHVDTKKKEFLSPEENWVPPGGKGPLDLYLTWGMPGKVLSLCDVGNAIQSQFVSDFMIKHDFRDNQHSTPFFACFLWFGCCFKDEFGNHINKAWFHTPERTVTSHGELILSRESLSPSSWQVFFTPSHGVERKIWLIFPKKESKNIYWIRTSEVPLQQITKGRCVQAEMKI